MGDTQTAVELTDEERDIIRHSLGLDSRRDKRRAPYRNYYCASVTDTRWPPLVARGLATRGQEINEGKMVYFYVTLAGAKAVGSRLPKDE